MAITLDPFPINNARTGERCSPINSAEQLIYIITRTGKVSFLHATSHIDSHKCCFCKINIQVCTVVITVEIEVSIVTGIMVFKETFLIQHTHRNEVSNPFRSSRYIHISLSLRRRRLKQQLHPVRIRIYDRIRMCTESLYCFRSKLGIFAIIRISFIQKCGIIIAIHKFRHPRRSLDTIRKRSVNLSFTLFSSFSSNNDYTISGF